MRILVLGGTRFCGREVVRRLLLSSHEVTVSSRRTEHAPAGSQVVPGERRHAIEKLCQLPPFDAVLDFTAYTAEDVDQALSAFPHSRYFLISSIWVKKLESAGETLPGNTARYLAGKIDGELRLKEAHRKGAKVSVLRLPVLMGEGDHTHRLEFYQRRLHDGHGLLLVDGASNKFQPAYVQDVAEAISRLTTSHLKDVPFLIEEVPPALTLLEFLETLSVEVGVPLNGLEIPLETFQNHVKDYLDTEPFWRERTLSSGEASLFKFTGLTHTPISDWLRMTVRQAPPTNAPSPRLPGELRLLERVRYFTPAIHTLKEAGNLLLTLRGDNSAKKVHDQQALKTEADRKVHLYITDRLRQAYPGIPIISEEDGSHSSTRPPLYWLIDPIDGTASWLNGFNGFACQAALIQDGTAVFGAIHAPALATTWTGISGVGAWRNGKLLSAHAVTDRLVLTDNYPEPRGLARKIYEELPATQYLESGSLGLKGVLVADGTADLFVKDVAIRDWDIAPLLPILAHTKRRICLPNGDPFLLDGSYEKQGVVISRDLQIQERTLAIMGTGRL